MTKTDKSPNWGGKRPGSGRKAMDGVKTNRTFRLSEQEYSAIKEYLKQLRMKGREKE